jgi:hypothetical protein
MRSSSGTPRCRGWPADGRATEATDKDFGLGNERERPRELNRRGGVVDHLKAEQKPLSPAPEMAGSGRNRRRLGLVWGAVAGDRGVAARGIWWSRRERAAKPRGRATASKSASSWPGR